MDPLAQLAQTDAELFKRFFSSDHLARQAERDQIAHGMATGLDAGQIAAQMDLSAGVVADQMLSIELGARWSEADQNQFVEGLLRAGTDDIEGPLRGQVLEIDSLLTRDHPQWYRQLRAEGMPADQLKQISPLLLQRLAERHAMHDPLLMRELPQDSDRLAEQMRSELIVDDLC